MAFRDQSEPADPNYGDSQFFDVDQPLTFSVEEFEAKWSEVGNIWVQAIDGSNGRQITNFTSGTISAFRWSPDGKSLVVHRKHHNSDIVLLRDSEL